MNIFELVRRLESADIHFELKRYQPETITLLLTVPNERIEVNLFESGEVEVCRFKGHEGRVGDEQVLTSIVKEYSSES